MRASSRWSALAALSLALLVLPGGAGGAAADEAPSRDEPAFWLARAQGRVAGIDHPDGKAASLVSVAAGWLEAGRPEDAKRVLGQALGFATECEGCFAKVQRLVDVGMLQHEAGDLEGAEATFSAAFEAARDLEPAFRAAGHAAVGRAMGIVEDPRAPKVLSLAEKEAKGMLGEAWLDAMREVVAAKAGAGDLEGAQTTLGFLEKGAKRLESHLADWAKVYARDLEILLADLEAQGGDLEAALARAKGIADPLARARALLAVGTIGGEGQGAGAGKGAEAAAAAQLEAAWSGALSAGQKVKETPARVLVLAEIARAAARAGRTSEANVAAGAAAADVGAIENHEAVLEAMLAMAVTWDAVGEAKRVDETLAAAKKVVETFPVRGQDGAWAALAAGAGDAGRFEVALEATARMVEPRALVRTWARLGDAAARRGERAVLADLVGRTSGMLEVWPEALDRSKDEALRFLAVLEARAGRLEAAAKTVERIERPFHAVAAETAIARHVGERASR